MFKSPNLFHKTTQCFNLFENKNNLLNLLDDITKKLNIPATIIGGAALPKYNYNRATEDIDLITTVENAYTLGNELTKLSSFKFIGHSKFMHNSGIAINFCPEGIQAGHYKFPPPESNKPGLSYISLPKLLSMKIQSKRLKDRADYVELIKRNNLTIDYIDDKVIPLLGKMDKKWASYLYNQAQKEIT